ncbi:MAG TPA: DUF1003 domain-containing protein [Candidatus Paceibacterota bacterium]|nr:DUF1003 domain-containing protein [Candidatus Paceibacterota bacterium]
MKREERLTSKGLSEDLHSRINFEHTWVDTIADYLTRYLGTVSFFFINVTFFAVWIIWNSGLFGFTSFDPFPFGFLTMLVSLEAIFLSVIVLISQNRQSKIADIRQKIEFEVDVRSEEETTKILKMLDGLHKHLGIQSERDRELRRLERPTDLEKIQKAVEKEE